MYKGYTVREIILKDYQHPETAVIVDVSCGCSQCEEMDQVQPGHSLCGLLPDNLRYDNNIFPRLDSTHGWIAEFTGDDAHVDEWLELAA